MSDSSLKLENQICFPIYSASRLITKAYKPFLAKMGLTYPQYLVLMVLWEEDGLPVNKITERLMLNTNTLSPLLKRMEKTGLLSRQRSAEDERSVVVRLTEKGTQLKKEAKPIPQNLLSQLINENVELSDVLQLKEMLNEWIKVLSGTPEKEKLNTPGSVSRSDAAKTLVEVLDDDTMKNQTFEIIEGEAPVEKAVRLS